MSRLGSFVLLALLPPTLAAHSPQQQFDLLVKWTRPDAATISWSTAAHPHSPYFVYLDGQEWSECYPGMSILAKGPPSKCDSAQLSGLDPYKTYNVEVKVGENSKALKPEAPIGTLSFDLRSIQPDRVLLSDLEPDYSIPNPNRRMIGRATSEKPLSIGGTKYDTGIRTIANADTEYDLKGLFSTFSCVAGLEETWGTKDRITVEFVILGDGKELWRTSPLKRADGSRTARVDIKGVKRLTLRTISSDGDQTRFNRGQSNWAAATLEK